MANYCGKFMTQVEVVLMSRVASVPDGPEPPG